VIGPSAYCDLSEKYDATSQQWRKSPDCLGFLSSHTLWGGCPKVGGLKISSVNGKSVNLRTLIIFSLFVELPQMWNFVDLQFTVTNFFVIFGLITSASEQICVFSICGLAHVNNFRICDLQNSKKCLLAYTSVHGVKRDSVKKHTM
jgi:hypothetical protein